MWNAHTTISSAAAGVGLEMVAMKDWPDFLPAFGHQTDFLSFRAVFPEERQVQAIGWRPDSLSLVDRSDPAPDQTTLYSRI